MVDCGMLVLFLRPSEVTVATNYTVPRRMQILPRTERRTPFVRSTAFFRQFAGSRTRQATVLAKSE
jgi:hypothetical protein